MRKLAPAVGLVFVLTMIVNAQVQKTPHNRVFIDEDYDYTEQARLARNVDELIKKGMALYKEGDYLVRTLQSVFGVEAEGLCSRAVCDSQD